MLGSGLRKPWASNNRKRGGQCSEIGGQGAPGGSHSLQAGVYILGTQGREEELGEDMGVSLAASVDNQSRLGFILGVMCYEQ